MSVSIKEYIKEIRKARKMLRNILKYDVDIEVKTSIDSDSELGWLKKRVKDVLHEAVRRVLAKYWLEREDVKIILPREDISDVIDDLYYSSRKEGFATERLEFVIWHAKTEEFIARIWIDIYMEATGKYSADVEIRAYIRYGGS